MSQKQYKAHFVSLKKKWLNRQNEIQKTLLDEHREAIDWLPREWVANIDDAQDIARVANNLLSDPRSSIQATKALELYCCKATKVWLNYLQGKEPTDC